MTKAEKVQLMTDKMAKFVAYAKELNKYLFNDVYSEYY